MAWLKVSTGSILPGYASASQLMYAMVLAGREFTLPGFVARKVPEDSIPWRELSRRVILN